MSQNKPIEEIFIPYRRDTKNYDAHKDKDPRQKLYIPELLFIFTNA